MGASLFLAAAFRMDPIPAWDVALGPPCICWLPGSWPTCRVAGVVQHGQDMDEISLHRVKEAKGKARKKGATDTGNYLGIQQRGLLQAFEL